MAPLARREHPDGEIIRAGAYARGASRLDERRAGDGGRARRPCASGASPDRRGGARGRSQRRAWTGTLRARRGRQSRLSQRLSAGQDEDGGGRRGLFGSASPGHARAVCVERAGGAFGTHAGTRATGGRTLRAGPVDARHRGHFHRRDRPAASVAGGGERDHREAVGRVRRLLQARSLRTRDRLPVYRRHRRAAASGPAARSGSGRLGDRRGRTQIAAWG